MSNWQKSNFKWIGTNGRSLVFGVDSPDPNLVVYTDQVRGRACCDRALMRVLMVVAAVTLLPIMLMTAAIAVLWRAPKLTFAHVRPQVDENDEAFFAVERLHSGTGWIRIRRHRMEKCVRIGKTPFVTDVDVKGSRDSGFSRPVWRSGDAAGGAGVMVAVRGLGGLGLLCAAAVCA